jgi:hypothetical protein
MNIWSGPKTLLNKGVLGCPDGKLAGRTTVADRPATWILCPSGSSLDSGHTILQWATKDIVNGVSIHGYSPVNRKLALVLARRLAPAKPPN